MYTGRHGTAEEMQKIADDILEAAYALGGQAVGGAPLCPGTVILAKSAGFCYGVRRAVDLARKTAVESNGCWMLGDLIHNANVVRELEELGVRKTTEPETLGAGDTVVIRSHGELKHVLDGLEERGAACVNATCPNVCRIQKLVAQSEQEGRRPSSSASPTTRRLWDLPAGAPSRWCSADRRMFGHGLPMLNPTGIFP